MKNVKRFMNKSNLANPIEIIKPSLEDMCTLDQITEKEGNKKNAQIQVHEKNHEEKEHNYLKTTTMPTISPLQLDQLERSLEYVEASEITNEQNICVVLPNLTPQIIFTEKYISVEKIQKEFLPDYNLTENMWLFQRLTETFDQKIMTKQFAQTIKKDMILSINTNVSSILSYHFDAFIAQYNLTHDAPLILEFKIFDILANLKQYFEVKSKLKKLGCRICVEYMDLRAIGVIDHNITDIDFIKIPWNKHDLKFMAEPFGAEIKAKIKALNKMQVILIHCGEKEAITFGQSLGIKIFQGFYVDKLQSQ